MLASLVLVVVEITSRYDRVISVINALAVLHSEAGEHFDQSISAHVLRRRLLALRFVIEFNPIRRLLLKFHKAKKPLHNNVLNQLLNQLILKSL